MIKMKARAKFLRAYTFNHRNYRDYEYRGEEYTVCTDWNAEHLSWQHRYQQDYIDRILATECKSTENAQVGLDFFFETLEQE